MARINHIKRSFSSAFRIALPTLVFFLCSEGQMSHADQSLEKNIAFRWAIAAMESRQEHPKPFPIDRRATLKTGDKLKIFLELKKNCHVYVIYRDSEGELFLLFPQSLRHGGADMKISGKHYIPQGEQWFELDDKTGREKFYLLASAEPLTRLETLLSRYEASSASMRKEIARKIHAEIILTRKRHKGFTSTAERPIPIGGSMRGTTTEKASWLPKIDAMAVEVSAANFFYRTYTIEHR